MCREIARDLARAQIEEKGGGLCKLDEGRRVCYFKSKNKEWTPVKRILALLMTIAITVGALPPAMGRLQQCCRRKRGGCTDCP